MKILWRRVIAFGLVVVAVVLFVANRAAVMHFVSAVGHIGSEHSTDERTLGLIASGLIVVALLGALRLVLNDPNRSQP